MWSESRARSAKCGAQVMWMTDWIRRRRRLRRATVSSNSESENGAMIRVLQEVFFFSNYESIASLTIGAIEVLL